MLHFKDLIIYNDVSLNIIFLYCHLHKVYVSKENVGVVKEASPVRML